MRVRMQVQVRARAAVVAALGRGSPFGPFAVSPSARGHGA